MAILKPIRYLTTTDVNSVLQDVDVMGVIRKALILHATHHTLLPPEASLYWPAPTGGEARSLALPAGVNSDGLKLGLKVINANPLNHQLGLPRASGIVLLFDANTARVRALLQAEDISSLRTAAVSSIAVSELGVSGAETVTIVGAGALAEAHLSLLPQAMPTLREVIVVDSDPKRLRALVEARQPELGALGISLTGAGNPEEALRSSQVVVCVTTTNEPYINFSMLSPGTAVVNVSLDDCAADVFFGCDLLLVDDETLVGEDRRRMLGRLMNEGLIGSTEDAVRGIDGDLGTLLHLGMPRRSTDEDIILVNPFGLGIEDIALADAVVRLAETRGVGQLLEG